MPTIAIAGFFDTSRIVDLKASSKADALRELCRAAAGAPEVTDPEGFLRAVMEREEIMSTGIGLGIAVPHAKIGSVAGFTLTLGRSKAGIDFEALDRRPVHLVVLIAGPENRQARYLQILASVTLRLKREDVRKELLAASGPEEILAILSRDG